MEDLWIYCRPYLPLPVAINTVSLAQPGNFLEGCIFHSGPVNMSGENSWDPYPAMVLCPDSKSPGSSCGQYLLIGLSLSFLSFSSSLLRSSLQSGSAQSANIPQPPAVSFNIYKAKSPSIWSQHCARAVSNTLDLLRNSFVICCYRYKILKDLSFW